MKGLDKIKEFIGQIMNTKVLAIIFIVGIGLLLLPTGSKETKSVCQSQELGFLEYKEELEGQLTKILSSVKGAGSVEVMITLENTGESYVAADERVESADDKESQKTTGEKTFVLKNDAGGGESPVVLRKNMPSVSGVLVIASGANEAKVRSDLINAVQALLGVKAHRVEVLQRK